MTLAHPQFRTTPDPSFQAACSLLDCTPLPGYLLDGEGRVVHVNAAELARSGTSADAVVGASFLARVAPLLERQGMDRRFREQLAAGTLRLDLNLELPDPSGKRLVQLRLRSVEFDRAVWGVAWLEDRSELRTEQERRRRAERLAAVGELAAGVAHEVNNPLASIKSFAQLLLREPASDEQLHALEIIVHESTRVAGIVGSLLSFVRQQGVEGREPVNMNAIADRVLALQRYALETAGIAVRRDYDAGLSMVMADVGALEQVLLNLVVNAEQALNARAGERRLIIRTRESSEGVIVSVVDNGPGIPRDLLQEIFDPFRTTKAEGTGLGLGISATIVREHGGQIWAESEEERGAAFFVQLPRASQAVAQHSEAPRRGLPPATRALRLLVADDESALRLAISVFLQRRGHRVIQAADAHEALRLASEEAFDAALVDVRMPGDGLALIEQLDALPGMAGRTAIMTGDVGRARTSAGITSGRPFLSKPFDMDDMVRLVESLAG